MFTVLLRGLEFYGYHGVPPAERQIGHRYHVDLEIEVEGSAHRSDRVQDTVDYARVGEIVIGIGTGQQFQTVERLGQAIGDALLKEFKSIDQVGVEVLKLLPPYPADRGRSGSQNPGLKRRLVATIIRMG